MEKLEAHIDERQKHFVFEIDDGCTDVNILLQRKEDRCNFRLKHYKRVIKQLRKDIALAKFETCTFDSRLPTDSEFALLSDKAQNWYRKYAPDTFAVAKEEVDLVCGLNGCRHKGSNKANATRHRELCAKRQMARALDLAQSKQSTLSFAKRQRTN